jgi:hypothetical protein
MHLGGLPPFPLRKGKMPKFTTPFTDGTKVCTAGSGARAMNVAWSRTQSCKFPPVSLSMPQARATPPAAAITVPSGYDPTVRGQEISEASAASLRANCFRGFGRGENQFSHERRFTYSIRARGRASITVPVQYEAQYSTGTGTGRHHDTGDWSPFCVLHHKTCCHCCAGLLLNDGQTCKKIYRLFLCLVARTDSKVLYCSILKHDNNNPAEQTQQSRICPRPPSSGNQHLRPFQTRLRSLTRSCSCLWPTWRGVIATTCRPPWA